MPNTIKGASAPQVSLSDRSSSAIPDLPVGSLSVDLGRCPIEYGKRYLLTANADGTPAVREIAENAAIASQSRYLEMLVEGSGSYVSTPDLERFIEAAQEMLRKRQAFGKSRLLAEKEVRHV